MTKPDSRPTAAPELSPASAFVVHLARGSGEDQEAAGRVEHVLSGRACRFSSLADLLAFMRRILDDQAHPAADLGSPQPTQSQRPESPMRPRTSLITAATMAALLLSSASPSAAAVDLVAHSLEVTQTIQSLQNSVRLVAKKGTWVRIHASSNGAAEVPNVVTRMVARRLAPGPVTFLGWLDSPPTKVIANPLREQIGHAFNIEVPYAWRTGTVEFTALVDFPGDVPETNEQNNAVTATVTFEDVPPIRLRLFGVEFPGGTLPAPIHYTRIAQWLRRSFPTSALLIEQKVMTTQFNWGNSGCNCATDADGNCIGNATGMCMNAPFRTCTSDMACGCGFLNEMLMTMRQQDAISDPTFQPDTRYVALVDDGQGFMRGCSPGADAKVAAGPVGSDDWGWDDDGSYADWYTAHELGHAYGRAHAGCCGASNAAAYPYQFCRMNQSHAGFDTDGPRSLSPLYRDIMSYCPAVWTSDFTFEAIMDRLILEKGLPPPPQKLLGSYVLAKGSANLTKSLAALSDPLFLPAVRARPSPGGGDWELRFVDAAGGTLASHFFTPDEIEDDHDLVPPSIPQDGHVRDRVAVFAETLAVPPGPVAGLVLLHDDVELDFRAASAHPPMVEILTPNGGETIGRDARVEWIAADDDGDELRFTVLYSADAGASWSLLADQITATAVDVDLHGLPGGDAALFRVLASDGFHTTADDSDAVFSVDNAPPAVLLTDPGDDTVIEPGQTAMFAALAHDPEDGVLDGDSLLWTSDRQGTLGSGAHLELGNALVPGTHVVTVTATDSGGASASASVVVVKGSAAADICPALPRDDCDPAVRAKLALVDRRGRRPLRKLALSLVGGGPARDGTAFGQPTASTTQALCIYEGGRLRDALPIEPSSTDWRPLGARGFRYLQRDSDGLQTATLKAGKPARPAPVKVAMKGVGAALPPLPAALELPVVVQVVNDSTPACVGAERGAERVRQNRKGLFRAR